MSLVSLTLGRRGGGWACEGLVGRNGGGGLPEVVAAHLGKADGIWCGWVLPSGALNGFRAVCVGRYGACVCGWMVMGGGGWCRCRGDGQWLGGTWAWVMGR
jgi:hypothetical protein